MGFEPSQLDRDRLFVALTRPQTFAGVSYSVVVLNVIFTTELFLSFKSAWVVAGAVAAHAIGWLASLREPRIFELWKVRVSACPRIANWSVWRCNAYRP